MNKTGKATREVQPEEAIFAEMLREKMKASGLSQSAFARSLGIPSASVHLSHLFNAKRGLRFWKALRIANAAGIDLREVQWRTRLLRWP